MDRCHRSFEALVSERVAAEPRALIYGVTSAPGDSAPAALTDEARAERPDRLWTAMSFGDPLPDRVVRAILVARLANFLDGHAAVRSHLAQAVADMLHAPRLPRVPAQSNGGSGEILALGTLFFELSTQIQLTAKERMALINGSPCAAALAADVALAGRRRIELADAVFALAAEICALSAVTDNPMYLPPDSDRPLGAVYSTGGYHNARAAPAIDAVAFAQADLCQLAQRLTDHLFQNPLTARLVGYDEWSVKPLHMVQNGWAEEAPAIAAPTLLSLGGFGQNDVPVLNFLAWSKAIAIGRCLDASLAVLAAIASHAAYVDAREPPPNLREFTDEIRDAFPPVDQPRALGADCQRLTDAFAGHVFAGREIVTG